MDKHEHNAQSGFSLLLAMIVASVALAIGLSLLDLSMKEIELAASSRDSEIAFQAANAGLECARYVRRSNTSAILSQNDITSDCFGGSNTLTANASGNEVQYEREVTGWDPSGNGTPLCIRYDIYTVDNSGGSNPVAKSFVDQLGVTRNNFDQCQAGDICSVAIARGYNVPCADIGNVYTVQRELSAEF